MHMPEMDGIEATRAMRELESRRDDGHRVPILALTADDSDADRQRSLDAGCDDHLVKPVSKRALLAALAAHTRR
jgi:two-component system sensor histidine kinase/response regulator